MISTRELRSCRLIAIASSRSLYTPSTSSAACCSTLSHAPDTSSSPSTPTQPAYVHPSHRKPWSPETARSSRILKRGRREVPSVCVDQPRGRAIVGNSSVGRQSLFGDCVDVGEERERRCYGSGLAIGEGGISGISLCELDHLIRVSTTTRFSFQKQKQCVKNTVMA